MASFQVGFYTVTILAACKAILVASEILFNKQKKIRFLALFGFLFTLLALILGSVSFVGLRGDGPHVPGQCNNADADIVGDGVRAATWIQVGILFFIALTGAFHQKKTAVKEIGGGLIVTHVSLAIALLVPLAGRTLSPIDAILGALILDAQRNSLSLQLVTKETLAARWQVAVVLIAQLFSLVIEGILVGSFTTHRLLPTNGCECFSVFWWAWLSNCPSASPNDVKPYWIYFGYRSINIVHGSYFAITRTTTFHRADLWDRENSCDPCDNCRMGTEFAGCKCHPCEGCNYCNVCKRKKRCHYHQTITPTQNPSGNAIIRRNPDICLLCYRCRSCGHSDMDSCTSDLLYGVRFSEFPATISINFLESSVLAILSMASAEVTMKANSVQKSSQLYNVGQVTALIIALGTTVRAIWVFLYMFVKDEHSGYK
ncbi:hypothetical protein GGS26DRAFT_190914 [Hypomontagnella submonticulosa]|nr:hypothetical protein GGS26DRAFT_190914 [Hypomontagnella submonticulosa]